MSSLEKHSNTITKLRLNNYMFMSLSFIVKLTKLEELVLRFNGFYREHLNVYYRKLEVLQHAIFPHLWKLVFWYGFPNDETLIKFLENNGRNLKHLYIKKLKCSSSLESVVTTVCPNIELIITDMPIMGICKFILFISFRVIH